jgi:hypothetical protein
VALRQLAGDSSNFFQIFCKIRFSVRVEKKNRSFPETKGLAGKQRWQRMNKGHKQTLKDAQAVSDIEPGGLAWGTALRNLSSASITEEVRA